MARSVADPAVVLVCGVCEDLPIFTPRRVEFIGVVAPASGDAIGSRFDPLRLINDSAASDAATKQK